MHKNGIWLKVIGNLFAPDASLKLLLVNIGAMTAQNKNRFDPNTANYGGRLGVRCNPCKPGMPATPDRSISALAEIAFQPYLSWPDVQEPDLLACLFKAVMNRLSAISCFEKMKPQPC